MSDAPAKTDGTSTPTDQRESNAGNDQYSPLPPSPVPRNRGARVDRQADRVAVPLQSGRPHHWVSCGLLAAAKTIPMEVPFNKVVAFVNSVSTTAMAVGLVDVQFALAKRTSKAAVDLEAIYGIVVDVDRPTQDILEEVAKAGVSVPNFAFPSLNGFKKPAYVTTTPMSPDVFTEHAMAFTARVRGRGPAQLVALADAAHADLQQDARGRRSSARDVRRSADERGAVRAGLVNDLAAVARAPRARCRRHRTRRPRGCSRVSPGAWHGGARRAQLDAERRLPRKGALREEDHVNVAPEGAITVHCCGGHDGQGPKHWNEMQLADAAGAAVGRAVVERFDPMRDLPVTDASQQYIRYRLRDWSAQHVAAVLDSLAASRSSQRGRRSVGRSGRRRVGEVRHGRLPRPPRRRPRVARDARLLRALGGAAGP